MWWWWFRWVEKTNEIFRIMMVIWNWIISNCSQHQTCNYIIVNIEDMDNNIVCPTTNTSAAISGRMVGASIFGERPTWSSHTNTCPPPDRCLDLRTIESTGDRRSKNGRRESFGSTAATTLDPSCQHTSDERVVWMGSASRCMQESLPHTFGLYIHNRDCKWDCRDFVCPTSIRSDLGIDNGLVPTKAADTGWNK